MERTGLITDNYCLYDQQTEPYDYTTNEVQINNDIPIGTIGLPVTRSNHPKPEFRNVESMLKGLGDTLSRCLPPPPKVTNKIKLGNLKVQNLQNSDLIQTYTREKHPTVPVSSKVVTQYNYNPHLQLVQQKWDRINFTGTPQRGGLHTSQMIKEAWNSETCSNFISPDRACGVECSKANGYMGFIPGSNWNNFGKLPTGSKNSWFSPENTDSQVVTASPQPITSQLLHSLGMEHGLTGIPDGPTREAQEATSTTSVGGHIYKGNPYKGILPR